MCLCSGGNTALQIIINAKKSNFLRTEMELGFGALQTQHRFPLCNSSCGIQCTLLALKARGAAQHPPGKALPPAPSSARAGNKEYEMDDTGGVKTVTGGEAVQIAV